MPRLKPQTLFLLRGSALLVGLLSLWWFVLVDPMVYVLKDFAGAFLRIQESPAGDWSLRVPLEMTLPASPERPVAQQVHSIDFDMPRADVVAFTFSLPVFWAIVLAAPGWRRNLRPLAIGTGIMALVELLLLLLYAEVSAHKAAAQLAAGPPVPFDEWLLRVAEYLAVTVLPYALPVIAAFAVHRDLRWLVFRWGTDPDVVPVAPPRPLIRRKRR